MEPTFRQLRYFVATANASQVSRAAIELNVSQSAVTTAIRQLEDVLAIRLFDRHPAGVALTYEGHLFLAHARHIIAAMEEAVRMPSRRGEDVRGSLRLAVTYTVAGYFLPPHLARFTRGFPNVDVQLVEADRTSIEEGLIAGEFDLAVILISNIINQEDLSYERLLASRRRLWVSAQHRLIQQPTVTLKDIASEPYIMLTVDEASNTAQRYWNRSSYRPRSIFRTSSVEAVRSMVGNGMGVAVLSDMVYRPWSLDGRRVEVLSIDDRVPAMDVGFAWANSVDFNEACRAFMEFMHLAVLSAD